jgi:integrase
VLELFARTGQRMTPIRLLTWDRIHIDSPPQRITFPRAKGGKHHTLPIGEDKALLMALITYRRLVNPLPTDWVLKSNQQKPLSEQPINRIIERACRAAGVRRGTAHEFRRSCITNALMRGEKLEVVSRGIANHSNPAITVRHYRQIPEIEVAKALKGLY